MITESALPVGRGAVGRAEEARYFGWRHAETQRERALERLNLEIHSRVATPNDLKLSDRRSGRGTCRWVARRGRSAAGAVTAEPVRCSAWFGVAVIARKVVVKEV